MKMKTKAVNFLVFITGLVLIFLNSCQLEKQVLLPVLSTITLTNVTSISAACGGNVISDGGSEVTARGVCWSSNFNPTISDNITNDGTGVSSFKSSVTELKSGTNYYIRAYATNSVGTAYGNELIFITPLTDIDGNVYGTVVIGSQVWMTENLKTTKFNDNTGIPCITENATWITLSTPAYAWYNNNKYAYDQKYGVLYNWFTVNTGKLCPEGWHVPSETEWTILVDFLGGEYYAGGKLKEQGIDHWVSPNEGAMNDLGFTALPGGYRSGLTSGSFRALGYIGWWWTNTESELNWSRNRTIAYDVSEIAMGKGLKTNGYSVRCIRNNE